jgi:hypothetical protein
MLISGLSNKAQEAVKDAFEAMSDWRTEAVDDSERNTKRVIEKMAAAAAALGWPEQVVDAAREQMQRMVEIQISTIDRMMDAWEEQLKNPLTASSTILPKLTASPDFSSAVLNPVQFWMHSVEQWQKLWTRSVTAFLSQDGKATGRRPGAGT